LALTNIYLARHGETEYNRCDKIQGRGIDASLNDTGFQQARAIARYLQEVPLHGIFSSSLKRSKETAAVIAETFNLQVESYKDLDEMNFGVFEGRHASEIKSGLEDLHKKWKSGYVDYACENGESPRAVLRRVRKRTETIIADQPNSNLLFVLHGRLLRILLSHWLQFGLSDMHRVPHSNGALYHVRWDGESFEPVYLNKTEHLNVEA
jgi:probable phosphoglycerate mutase